MNNKKEIKMFDLDKKLKEYLKEHPLAATYSLENLYLGLLSSNPQDFQFVLPEEDPEFFKMLIKYNYYFYVAQDDNLANKMLEKIGAYIINNDGIMIA